jgi:hypothetical protein
MFLAHDAAWHEQGEPLLVVEFRQDAIKVEPPAADALGKAALEVEVWQLAFGGDWIGASEKLQQAAPHVGCPSGDCEASYQAVADEWAGIFRQSGLRSGVWESRSAPSAVGRSRVCGHLEDDLQAVFVVPLFADFREAVAIDKGQ